MNFLNFFLHIFFNVFLDEGLEGLDDNKKHKEELEEEPVDALGEELEEELGVKHKKELKDEVVDALGEELEEAAEDGELLLLLPQPGQYKNSL